MTKKELHASNPDEPPSYEEATAGIDILVVAAPSGPPAYPVVPLDPEAAPAAKPSNFAEHIAAAAADMRTQLGCAAVEVRRELGCAAVDVRRELGMAQGEVTRGLADACGEVQKGLAEARRSLFACNRPLTGCKRGKGKC